MAAREKIYLEQYACEVLWAFTLFDLFPCGTMLSPFITEEQRDYTRSRNIGFDKILKEVTSEYQLKDVDHHYVYTDVVFVYPFVESQVSDIDCFHPSAVGQKELSRITWEAGESIFYAKTLPE